MKPAGGVSEASLTMRMARFAAEELRLRGFAVRLTRDGVTYNIDLDRLGRQGGGATNIFLKANDHLYVPYLDRKEVFVVGEVNQPGAMNFKTSDISLSQALGRAPLAGAFLLDEVGE